MDKIYVGNGKEVETKFGPMLKLSFNKDDLKKLQDNLNEKGYVNLNVNKRKEESEFGSTHYMVVDNWKPEKKPETKDESGITEDDLPF